MKLLFGFLVAYAFVTLVTAQNRTKRASGQRCLGLFDYYDSCEGSESREHHRRRPRKRPPPPPDSGECNPGCVRVPVYQGGCSPGCVLLRDCNSVSVQTSTTGCLRAADAKRIFDKFERLLEKQIIFEQKMSDVTTTCEWRYTSHG